MHVMYVRVRARTRVRDTVKLGDVMCIINWSKIVINSDLINSESHILVLILDGYFHSTI